MQGGALGWTGYQQQGRAGGNGHEGGWTRGGEVEVVDVFLYDGAVA